MADKATAYAGSLSLSFSSSLDGFLVPRDAGGRFVPRGKSDAARMDRNRQLAQRIQKEVVKAQKRSVRRPRVATGRLARALADPRNIMVRTPTAAVDWGVGDSRWLDRSEAKYWRQIDEGTTVHVGKPIYPVPDFRRFSRSRFSMWRAGNTESVTNRWGTYLRHTSNPGAANGKPYAITWAKGREMVELLGHRGYKPSIIKNPIHAQDLFERGFEQAGGRDMAMRVARLDFEDVFNDSFGWMGNVPREKTTRRIEYHKER